MGSPTARRQELTGVYFALELLAYQLGLYGYCQLRQRQGNTMGFATLLRPSQRTQAQAWWDANVTGSTGPAPGSATGGGSGTPVYGTAPGVKGTARPV